MQIFPTNAVDLANSLASTVTGALNQLDSAAGQSFSEVFSNVAAYNENMSAGVPAGFRSVRDELSTVSDADMAFLQRELERRGVDTKNSNLLTQLQGLRSGESLPGVAKLLNSLRGTSRKSEGLSDEEEMDFMSLCKKLGFSEEEISSLLGLASSGQGGKIMQALNNKLGALDGGLDLYAGEFRSLLRAMDLSDPAIQGSLAMLKGNGMLHTDAAGLNTLLGRASNELGADQANADKLFKETSKALKEMLDNAAQREAAALSSDNRATKKSARSELLMRDSATSTGEGGSIEKESAAAAILSRNNRAAARDLQSDAEFARKKWAEEDKGKEGKSHFLDRLSDKKQGLEGVAAPDSAAQAGRYPAKEGLVTAAVFNPVETPANNSSSQQAPTVTAQGRSAYADQLLAQVERGIVQNSSNGSHQITMRLDPPELGRLTLSLSVQEGELKAFIRAESAETAGLMAEQLADLKASLEEQGFKVNDLEVEARLQENPGESLWSGENGETLKEQLRENMDFFSFSRGKVILEDVMARNMHNGIQTETISHSGLHLVA